MKKQLLLGLTLFSLGGFLKGDVYKKIPRIYQHMIFEPGDYMDFLVKNHTLKEKDKLFVIAYYDLNDNGKIDLKAKYNVARKTRRFLGLRGFRLNVYTGKTAKEISLDKNEDGYFESGFADSDNDEKGTLEKKVIPDSKKI